MATAHRSLGSIQPDAFWHKPTVLRPANDPLDNVIPISIEVRGGDDDDVPPPEDGVLHIPTDDGGVIVDFSGKPSETGDEDESDTDANFDANLAEGMDALDLSRIAEDLLEGI